MKIQDKSTSLKALMALWLSPVYVLAAILCIALVNHNDRQRAMAEARDKARILMEQTMAILAEYHAGVVSKTLEENQADSSESFDPVLMSSFYNIRRINEIYNEKSPHPYHYKVCAINARSPASEAEPYEAEIIERFNENPNLKEYSAVIDHNGEPNLVLLRPGRKTDQSCLRCHSTPQAAPKGLVDIYGDSRGFNRGLGAVPAAYSIRIPLAEAFHAADMFSLHLTPFVICVLVLLYFYASRLRERFIFRPLNLVREKAALISASPDQHLGEEIPLPKGAELRAVTDSFNAMSRALHHERDLLAERVEERTSDLTTANEILIRTEKDLQQAKDEAERSNLAKTDFLAHMSHEIRTPLSVVIGMLQLLEGTGLSDEQREYLALLESSADGLSVILDDILDLSKIEAGKMDIHPRDTDLGEFLVQVGSQARCQAEKKGLTFTMELDPGLPEKVMVDKTRLRQILHNLLSNAIKFTPSGGVRLDVDCLDEPESGRKTHLVRFVVSDTGIGIPEEKRRKIFEQFCQGEDSISRRFAGTGLGLTIANNLLALLGGDGIHLMSQEGKGSTFSFSLPVAGIGGSNQAGGDSRPGESASQARNLSGLRVLVAEDNELNRYMIGKILEGLGVQAVDMVADGQQAVARIENSPGGYDLIMMDLQMPGMDGLTATRELRRMGVTLPIIALTAHAMKSDMAKALAAGMNLHVTKPYRVETIAAALSSVLEMTGSGPNSDLSPKG